MIPCENGECKMIPKCSHVCHLRVHMAQPISDDAWEAYTRGRRDGWNECVVWADHMERMVGALKARK